MCIVSSIGSFIYERYGQAGKDLVIPIYPLFVGFIKKYVSIMENHYNKNERCLNPRTPLQLCIYQARRSWAPIFCLLTQWGREYLIPIFLIIIF